MLAVNICDRLSIQEVKNHEWLNQKVNLIKSAVKFEEFERDI